MDQRWLKVCWRLSIIQWLPPYDTNTTLKNYEPSHDNILFPFLVYMYIGKEHNFQMFYYEKAAPKKFLKNFKNPQKSFFFKLKFLWNLWKKFLITRFTKSKNHLIFFFIKLQYMSLKKKIAPFLNSTKTKKKNKLRK